MQNEDRLRNHHIVGVCTAGAQFQCGVLDLILELKWKLTKIGGIYPFLTKEL